MSGYLPTTEQLFEKTQLLPPFCVHRTPLTLRLRWHGMTTLSLRQIRHRSGEQYRDTVETELQPLAFGGQRYLPIPDKVPADVAITKTTTGTVFELRLRARLHGPCQRCLTDAVVERALSLREYQATRPESDEMQTPYLVDDRLDLSAWARDGLALALPDKILCRPDCAGLCPVCGADLNVSPHEHEEETTDPRWSALAALREEL